MSTATKEDVRESQGEFINPSPVTINKVAVDTQPSSTDRNTNESAEEHVRRVSVSEKSEETKKQHTVHGDLAPHEILNYLGNAVKKQATTKNATHVAKGAASGKYNAGSVEKAGEKKVEKFTLDFLKALVPTPTVMGDLLSQEYAAESLRHTRNPNHTSMTLGEAAHATVSLHRELRGHVFQRRVSATARRCSFPDCNIYHYRPADVCYEHDASQNELYKQLLAKLRVKEIKKKEQEQATDDSVSAPTTPVKATATESVPETASETVPISETVPEEAAASPPAASAFPGVDDQDITFSDVALTSDAAAPASSITSPATTAKPAAAPVKVKPPVKTQGELLQEQVEYRRNMVFHAETLRAPARFTAFYAPIALKLLQTSAPSGMNRSEYPCFTFLQEDLTELVQLYHQFVHVLDGDKDGVLTAADVLNHLRTVDIDYLVAQQVKPPSEVLAMAERWLQACHPLNKARWAFADYVIAVFHHRELENKYLRHHHQHQQKPEQQQQQPQQQSTATDDVMTSPNPEENASLLFSSMTELLRTAFWDLRMILLLRPNNHPLSKWSEMTKDAAETAAETNEAHEESEAAEFVPVVSQGHMLKRGYFFANERLNAFRYRYFKVTGTELAYYKETWVQPPKKSPTKTNNNSNNNSNNNKQSPQKQEKPVEETASAASAPPSDVVGDVDDAKAGEEPTENVATDASPNKKEEGTGAMEDIAIEDDNNNKGKEGVEEKEQEEEEEDAKPTLKRDLKGSIPLQEIALVDFSPKTLLKFNRSLPYADAEEFQQQNYVIFKVTLYNGHRFTLAAKMPKEEGAGGKASSSADKEEEKEPNVLDWASYFYWWAEVSRRIVSWREQWGSGRQHRVTLRDWVNAGAVIAKVALIKEKKEKMTTTGALMSSAKYFYDKNSQPAPVKNDDKQADETTAEKEAAVQQNEEGKDETVGSSTEGLTAAADKDANKGDEGLAKEEATASSSPVKNESESKAASTAKTTTASIASRVSDAHAASIINHVSDATGAGVRVSKKDVAQGKKAVAKVANKNSSAEDPQKNNENEEEEKDQKVAAEDDSDDDEDLKLTERDFYYLEVVGLSADQLEEAGGVVVLAVKSYYISQHTVAHFDKHYTLSIGKTIVQTIYYSLNVFQYAAAAQNRIDSNKYGVKWDSASNTRDCAVCHYVFPTFSIRRTKTKHHCRVCGRVVCHRCSNTRVFLEVSKQLERVCTQCIENNGPPQDRLLLEEQAQPKTTASILRSHTNDAARKAIKKTLDVDDGEEDEDNDEEQGPDSEEEEAAAAAAAAAVAHDNK